MNARKLDRLTDVAIDVFMFAFRAVIIVVVVLGSILTLLSGTYTASDWFELVGAGLTQGSHLRDDRPGLHDGLRHPAHDQLRPRRDLHGREPSRGYFAPVALAQVGMLS